MKQKKATFPLQRLETQTLEVYQSAVSKRKISNTHQDLYWLDCPDYPA